MAGPEQEAVALLSGIGVGPVLEAALDPAVTDAGIAFDAPAEIPAPYRHAG